MTVFTKAVWQMHEMLENLIFFMTFFMIVPRLKFILNLILCLYQINPQSFVSENYYEVDGVLTTKLEQVEVTVMKKVLPKCPDNEALVGKGGVHYLKHGAFCLETQKFPDAVNHVNISLDFGLFFLNSFFLSGKLPIDYFESWTSLQSSSRLQIWKF